MIRPLLCLPLAALLLATPALAQEPSLEEQARQLHALAGGDWCDEPGEGFALEDDFISWRLTYQPGWSDEAPEESVDLVRLYCMSGAYNVTHNYYVRTEFEGLRPLALAEPDYDVQYENDDYEGAVEAITLTGMIATTTLVNSDFDPDTGRLMSWSRWRGLGDASASGTWEFREGNFILVKYDVDASYDGEINPETVLDYTGAR